MKIESVLGGLLQERRRDLAMSGVDVIEGPYDPRVRVEAPDELRSAVGHLLESALRAMSSRGERRLAVSVRPAGAGAVVELEVALADRPAYGFVEIFDAYHSGEDEAALGLVHCRRVLAEAGARVWIGSGPRNSIRFVIEIPAAPVPALSTS